MSFRQIIKKGWKKSKRSGWTLSNWLIKNIRRQRSWSRYKLLSSGIAFFPICSWRKQHPYIEADKTVLDKSQRDFLEKGPTCDDYLRAVQNFSNKLQLNSCIHSVAVRRNTTDKQHLLSKKHYVEDVCLDSFRKQN